MTKTEQFTAAYLEAAWFTEHEPGEPDRDFTPLFRCEAYHAARNFLQALPTLQPDLVRPLDELDVTQMAHDLWLTRNGHGTGFWDRNDTYTGSEARIFDALAQAMGEHEALFEEDEE